MSFENAAPSRAAPAAPRRFFFVHIMKTGGMSLELRTASNFQPHEVYPARSRGEGVASKLSPKWLTELPAERRREIRFYSVHMAFCTFELAGPDVVLVSLLRDPIARVVSHLKHAKRHVPGCAGRSLEEIYDVEWLFDAYFDNHQVRMFAMRLEDPHFDPVDEALRRYGKAIEADPAFTERINDLFAPKRDQYRFDLDESRMALAKANLVRVDALGLTDGLDELLTTLETDYGLRTADYPPANVGHAEPVSDELLARITRDNRLEIEFYEYARELVAHRRVARAPR